MSTKPLIGARVAADMLGMSRTTLLRRIRAGVIRPAAKLGTGTGSWVFDPAEIERAAIAEGKGELHKDDTARYQSGDVRGAA